MVGMKPNRILTSVFFTISLACIGVGCASLSDRKSLSDAERARLIIDVANAAISEGDTAGALENLLQAEKIAPELPELHHSKAVVFALRKEYSAALAEAREAVRLLPKYMDAKNTLGRILLEMGRYEEAIPPLTEAARDPLYREAFKPFTNLGILYSQKGEDAKAIQNFERAINLTPTGACAAYYYRGRIRLNESRVNEAIADFNKATRNFCVNYGDAHLALGIAYEKTGQYALARKKFLEVQERFPSTSLADQALNHLRYLP